MLDRVDVVREHEALGSPAFPEAVIGQAALTDHIETVPVTDEPVNPFAGMVEAHLQAWGSDGGITNSSEIIGALLKGRKLNKEDFHTLMLAVNGHPRFNYFGDGVYWVNREDPQAAREPAAYVPTRPAESPNTEITEYVDSFDQLMKGYRRNRKEALGRPQPVRSRRRVHFKNRTVMDNSQVDAS